MENSYAVVGQNITKIFALYNNHNQKIMDLLFSRGKIQSFYALKDVSFAVEKGECVGLIGLNGSGKSTLANIIGGISTPTSGSILIDGEPSLIAIGVGLNAYLTGMENIEFKGLMIGLSHKQIAEITNDIIAFADIGDFINQPVKSYSSGMKARLGFAISIHINPDILVVDEALSVGDPSFTNKCLEKMNEFRSIGKTIFFVSHNIKQVEEFCTKAMWMEYGILKAYGEVGEITPMYDRFLSMYNGLSPEQRNDYAQEIIDRQMRLMHV